jgi:hypothetical protein
MTSAPVQSRRFPFVFLLATAVVVGVGATMLLTQYQERIRLRGELDVARMQREDLARLQAENVRLRGKQISPADLEVLRADRAALARLKAELEALKKN